ncbi:MAG: hypothetical protein JWM71_37 [Solirubrobacteraceae bacterium]|nr:hypothetical protein [Solirubrobacteraceae bacterium]
MSAVPDIDVARQAYAAFARGDVEGALQFVSPDMEWRMSATFSRTERIFRGPDGVREVFALFAESIDDLSVEVLSLHDAPPQVLAEVRLGGTVSGTTDPVTHELVHAWTLRDGLIARLDVYGTLEEAWTAIGITPPAASSSSTDSRGTGLESR